MLLEVTRSFVGKKGFFNCPAFFVLFVVVCVCGVIVVLTTTRFANPSVVLLCSVRTSSI